MSSKYFENLINIQVQNHERPKNIIRPCTTKNTQQRVNFKNFYDKFQNRVESTKNLKDKAKLIGLKENLEKANFQRRFTLDKNKPNKHKAITFVDYKKVRSTKCKIKKKPNKDNKVPVILSERNINLNKNKFIHKSVVINSS